MNLALGSFRNTESSLSRGSRPGCPSKVPSFIAPFASYKFFSKKISVRRAENSAILVPCVVQQVEEYLVTLVENDWVSKKEGRNWKEMPQEFGGSIHAKRFVMYNGIRCHITPVLYTFYLLPSLHFLYYSNTSKQIFWVECMDFKITLNCVNLSCCK